jgi:RHS repeat-associated protein
MPGNVVSSVTYKPFPAFASGYGAASGPITGLTYGNGITGTYAYDADYRATSRVDAGSATVMNLAYAYDAADNVNTITDAVNAANSQTLTYDALNRLHTAASGTGGYGSWSWTWDAVHNAKTQVIAGTTTTFSQVSGTNRLFTSVTGSATTVAAYTAAGSLNTLKIGSTTTETLTWNAANELATASASGGSASYAYDLFGRRLEKAPGGGNTIVFQYAGLSPSLLLSENDLHSNQADYIYLDGRPIGEVNPSTGALYFTHTDALGTPQALTNGSAAVVWSMTAKPFGNTQTTAGSIVQHLRLPGQYVDSETGNHYNNARYYDPNGTRYVSSDPIGLAGGINTYQYVRGNPFKFTDRTGLIAGTGTLAHLGSMQPCDLSSQPAPINMSPVDQALWDAVGGNPAMNFIGDNPWMAVPLAAGGATFYLYPDYALTVSLLAWGSYQSDNMLSAYSENYPVLTSFVSEVASQTLFAFAGVPGGPQVLEIGKTVFKLTIESPNPVKQ